MLSKGQAIAILVLAIGARADLEEDGKDRELTGTLTMTAGNVGAENTFGAEPASTGGVLAPAPPAGLLPEPVLAPAPSVIAPQVVCTTYFQETGCDWTAKWNCPGQSAGSSGAAGSDESDGYKCCCLQGLWQNSGIPEPAASPTPSFVPSPSPMTGEIPPGYAGPPHLGHPILSEVIPRSIQLKHILIQWYEDLKECPLKTIGFPAWVGWKTATAAGPAVTTPPKGIAGNRTLYIEGFCPYLNSEDFTCVKEDGELKARAKTPEVALSLDGLSCNMQDISVYRLDGEMGVRFDFNGCSAAWTAGGRRMQAPFPGGGVAPPTTIKSASMNAGLEEDQTTLPGSDDSVQFSEFMLAVCAPAGNAKNVQFRTASLPKFARTPTVVSERSAQEAVAAQAVNPNASTPSGVIEMPSCFAETSNAAHVFGKGCFSDFLFFELQDHLGKLAKIPAHDLELLSNMVPHNQHWRKPVPVPAPVPGTPAPPAHAGMRLIVEPAVQVPTPAPAPVVDPADPCAVPTAGPTGGPCDVPKKTCASYVCPAPFAPRPDARGFKCKVATGCTILDKLTCCHIPTTFTTTVFVPEVPGVAIVDRICIEWRNCFGCNNLCDCKTRPPVSATTTTTWVPIVPVCEDFQWENLIIGFLSFLICCPLCCWFNDRCVAPWMRVQQKEDHQKAIDSGKYKPSAGMTTAMNSMTMGGGSMNASMNPTFSMGVDPNELRTLEAKTFKSTYLPCWMICINFISTGLICFAMVHVVFWFWNWIAEICGVYRDTLWSGIDIGLCPYSLFPLCIALWLMNWLCLVYYYAWQSYSYTVEVCETPVAVEINGMQQDGMFAWWRFWNPIPWVR